MSNHPVRKGAVALAAALSLLFLLASPASAVSAEVTGGTLTVHTSPAQSFDLGPAEPGEPEPPCPDKASTLDINFNTGSSTWSATGGFTGFFQLGNPPTGQWYQADFTLLTAQGGYSGSGPYALTSTGTHITTQVRIYPVGPNDCDKDTLLCILTGRMVVTAGSQHNGSIPPVAGDTTVLNATSNTTGGLRLSATSCQQPFSSMHNAHFDVAGLTFTY